MYLLSKQWLYSFPVFYCLLFIILPVPSSRIEREAFRLGGERSILLSYEGIDYSHFVFGFIENICSPIISDNEGKIIKQAGDGVRVK